MTDSVGFYVTATDGRKYVPMFGPVDSKADAELGAGPVGVGDVMTLADKASFYTGRKVEVLSVNPTYGTAWVKLANTGRPGTIEFNAKMEDLQ